MGRNLPLEVSPSDGRGVDQLAADALFISRRSACVVYHVHVGQVHETSQSPRDGRNEPAVWAIVTVFQRHLRREGVHDGEV